MKLLKSILVVLLFGNFAFAQIVIEGTILDATTKIPIPYVNIGVLNSSTGTVSNSQGVFQLQLKSIDHQIAFSSIGYERFEINAKDLEQNNTIELVKKDYLIEEIKIEATKFAGEEKRFGVKNKTRGGSISFAGKMLGTEIGTPIKIDRPTYIKSANFVLNHADGDSMSFRVNIYEFKDGKVGENLLKENILIKDKQRRGIITVDMTPYDLILDSNVLLSLEWIENNGEQGNEGITFDTKKSKKPRGIYYRKASLKQFTKIPLVKRRFNTCFYFIGKQEN